MITLLTHQDLDGCGAAVLARRAFEDKELEIKYLNYDNIDSSIVRNLELGEYLHRLLIVDISPQNESVYQLLDELHRKKTTEIVCLDHHASVADKLSNHPWSMCDTSQCGTRLFFLWLVHHDLLSKSEALVNFTDAIDAYDRWILDSPSRERGERLHRLCKFMGFEKFVDTFYSFLDADGGMYELDEMLIDRQKRYVENIVNQVTEKDIHTDAEGRHFALVISERHVSQVCDEVLKHHRTALYAVNISPSTDTINLRSLKDGVDVSKIAEQHGGGGHPTASGFSMPLREVLFKEIEKRLK